MFVELIMKKMFLNNSNGSLAPFLQTHIALLSSQRMGFQKKIIFHHCKTWICSCLTFDQTEWRAHFSPGGFFREEKNDDALQRARPLRDHIIRISEVSQLVLCIRRPLSSPFYWVRYDNVHVICVGA